VTAPMTDRGSRTRRWSAALVEFAILLGFWMAISDQYRPLFIAMGVVSAAVVTALTSRIVVTVLADRPTGLGERVRRIGWLGVFALWLMWSIARSSVQIARFVVDRRRPFQPRFVMFETQLERPISRVMLAVAITLVPGTMTVRLVGDRYLVHTLIPGSADDLASGRMQSFVARVTGEQPEAPPTMYWGPIITEAVR